MHTAKSVFGDNPSIMTALAYLESAKAAGKEKAHLCVKGVMMGSKPNLHGIKGRKPRTQTVLEWFDELAVRQARGHVRATEMARVEEACRALPTLFDEHLLN